LTRILVAAVASAAIGFVLITAAFALPSGESLQANPISVTLVLLHVAMPLLIAPVAAGAAGAWLAGDWIGAIGSVSGFVLGGWMAATLQSGGRPVAEPMAAGYFAILVLIGYASGLALRPKRSIA
jgi:hypothetical protein